MAANQKIGVSLEFNANIQQAQAQLKTLQKSLADLTLNSTKGKNGLGIDTEVNQAITAVNKLKVALASATTSTGTLDLSAFKKQLSSADLDANKLREHLTALGPEGSKTFSQLAQSVITAEIPLRRTKGLLSDFATTLKNTAKWQLSSSMIHGFMGALRGAYGYAQDLNESLNNIRIVTGQSVDDMAKFAVEANKAAKSLGSTTTAYTDAALIFYQQGLKGTDVTDRTDVVMKMANVTKQSAEEVSSYMTAIWNNFADGSESLEHYADVITALGATTASSSREIAEGLEKFAAVGETVGLSYEYATSALATVVANTRQSADIVGTAFKTIFSRLQGLTLGETLEDGVNLNKYSKALNAVGVQVLDTSGEMRKLDNILDDLAGKWDNLTSAQQTALAQTVAGTRQYNQLIALMNNWDDMESNLDTARGSEGSLQEQQDIYAESWEAANKRVKAALQGLYDTILDDKAFISITDNFAKLIELIDKLVKAMGGMGTILPFLSSALIGMFGPEIIKGADTFFENINLKSKKTQSVLLNFRSSFQEAMSDFSGSSTSQEGLIRGFESMGEFQAKVLDKQLELNKAGQDFTEGQKLMIQLSQQFLDAKSKEVEEVYKELEAAEKTKDKAKENVNNFFGKKEDSEDLQKKLKNAKANLKRNQKGKESADADVAEYMENNAPAEGEENNDPELNKLKEKVERKKQAVGKYEQEIAELNKRIKNAKLQTDTEDYTQKQEQVGNLTSLRAKFNNTIEKQGTPAAKGVYADTLKELKEMAKTLDTNNSAVKEFADAIEQLDDNASVEQMNEALGKMDFALEALKGESEDALTTLKNHLQEAVDAGNISEEEFREMSAAIENLGNATQKYGEKVVDAAQKTSELEKGAEEAGNSIGNFEKQQARTSEQIMKACQGITSLVGAFNSLKNIGEEINKFAEGEIGIGELILTILTGLATAVPLIIMGLKSLGIAFVTTGAEAAAGATGIAAFTAALDTNAIFLIITALALLVIGFSAIAAAAGKHKTALEKANESLDNAKKQAEEAKQAYDDLKTSLDNLESGYEKIKQLERGTAEWRQTILETNDALTQLLSQNGMLSADNYFVDEDGVMHLTEAAKEELKNNAERRMAMASTDAKEAQIRVNNANIGNQASEIDTVLQRSSNVDSSVQVSEVIAKALSTGVLNQGDLSNREQIEKLLEEQTNLSQDTIEALAGTITTNEDLQSKLVELGGEVAKNTEANAILTKQIAEENFGEEIENSGLSDQEKDGLATFLGNEINRKSDDLYAEKYEDKGKDGHGLKDKDIQQQYAEAMNYDWVADEKGNKGKYRNRQTGAEFELDDETARRYLATQEAKEQTEAELDNKIEEYKKLIEIGNNIGEGVGADLGGFVGGNQGNFNHATNVGFERLQNAWESTEPETDENGKITSFNFGDVLIDDSKAAELGFESAEAYYHAIDAAIKGRKADNEKLAENWLDATTDALNNKLNTSDLSLDQTKAIGNALNKSVIDGTQDSFIKLYKNIPIGKADEFAEVLKSVDWQTTDVNKLREQLERAGISTAGFSQELDDLIVAMQGNDIQALDALTARYKELHDIVKGLKEGDTISPEQYEKLNSNMQEFFTLTMDGTYRLVGSAKELKRLVADESGAKFKNNIDKYNDKSEQMRQVHDTYKNTFDDYTREAHIRPKSHDEKGFKYDHKSEKDYDDKGFKIYDDDEEYLNKQIEIAAAYGDYSGEQIVKWREQVKNGDTSVAKELAEAVKNCSGAFKDYEGTIKKVNEEQEKNMEAYASTLTSLRALDGALDDGTISAQAYAKSIEAVTQNEADLFDLDYQDIVDQAEAFKANHKELKLTDSQARQLAISSQRLDRGIETCNKSLKSWKNTLKTANKDSLAYVKATKEISAAVADLVGAQTDLALSGEFVEKNMALIEKAAKGNADAIKELGNAVAKNTIEQMENPFDQTEWFNKDRFEQMRNNVLAGMKGINDAIKTLKPGDSLKAAFDGSEDALNTWVADLNEMARITGMSVDEMNGLLNALNLDADVEVEYVHMNKEEPKYETIETVQEIGNRGGSMGGGMPSDAQPNVASDRQPPKTYKITSVTSQIGTTTMDAVVGVPKINSNKPIKVKNSPKASPAKQSGGGGGSKGSSSKSKKAKKKRYDDEFDRFYPYKKAIEDLTDKISDLNKEQDHMYGKDLFKKQEKEIDLLKQQKEATEELLAQQKKYRKQLAKELGAIDFNGKHFEFNAKTGNITKQSYKDATKEALKEMNAVEEWFSKITDPTEAEQEKYDAAVEKYETFKSFLGKYQGILKDIESSENQIRDLIYESVQKNFEHFELAFKLHLDIDEAKRELNEFIKKYKKDFTKEFQNMSIWKEVFTADRHEFLNSMDALKTLKKERNQLVKDLNNKNYQYGIDGSMSATAITESERRNQIIETDKKIAEAAAQAMEDLQNYWSDILDAQQEYFDHWDKINDKIEFSLNLYESLINLNNLLFGENSSKGQEKNLTFLRGRLEATKLQYDAVGEQLRQTKTLMDSLQNKDDKLYLEYQERYNDLLKRRLELSGNYLEVLKEIRDTSNMMNTNKVFEKLFGDTKDNADQRWDLYKRLNENYYDSTNKYTARNKVKLKGDQLLISAEQIGILNKYSKYVDEINKKLKEKNKLSKKAVELANAELDLLKAQIELEEAQKNKNSMKLVRDTSGNWTYQYVADQDNLAEKQQAVADAAEDVREKAKEAVDEAASNIAGSYHGLLEEYQKWLDNNPNATKEEQNSTLQSFIEQFKDSNKAEIDALKDALGVFARATSEEVMTNYFKDPSLYDSMTKENKQIVDYFLNKGAKTVSDISKIVGQNFDEISQNFFQDQDFMKNNPFLSGILNGDVNGLMDVLRRNMEQSNEFYNNEKNKINYDADIASTNAEIKDSLNEVKNEIKSNNWSDQIKTMSKAAAQFYEYMTQYKQAYGEGYQALSENVDGVKKLAGGIALTLTRIENELRKEEKKKNIQDLKDTIKTKEGSAYTIKNGAITVNGQEYTSEEMLAALPQTKDIKRAKQALKEDPFAEIQIEFDSKKKPKVVSISGSSQLNPSKYASGGYTGDWGSNEGKIAILHEKELILNKEDTQNILSAVKLTRGFGSIESSIQNMIAKLSSGFGNIKTYLFDRNKNEENNNTFEITMNVDGGNVEEIQQAILNLPNLANQYLNRV